MDKYHYTLSQLGGGSDKYGKCEVCKKDFDTGFLQTETQEYEELRAGSDAPNITLTRFACSDYIGHAECLVRVRNADLA